MEAAWLGIPTQNIIIVRSGLKQKQYIIARVEHVGQFIFHNYKKQC